MITGQVVCGWASKSTSRVDDLHRRVGDLQVDEHVVHRQRLGVVGEVQARRLLVADRAADQQPIVGEAVGADPVLAVVEDVEAVGVRGDDVVGAEHGPLSYPPRAAVSTRDTVTRHRPLHAPRPTRRAGPARRRARRRAGRGGRRATVRAYGYTEVPATAEHMPPTTSSTCSPSATPARRCRSPSAGSPTGASSGAPASWSCAAGAAATNPTRSRSAAPGWRADAQRSPINTEAKLLLLVHAFDVWQVDAGGAGHRRPQRAQPAGDRAHRRPLRGHAAPPPPVARRRARKGGPRDTALFAITDDDWPAVRSNLARRLASPTVAR